MPGRGNEFLRKAMIKRPRLEISRLVSEIFYGTPLTRNEESTLSSNTYGWDHLPSRNVYGIMCIILRITKSVISLILLMVILCLFLCLFVWFSVLLLDFSLFSFSSFCFFIFYVIAWSVIILLQQTTNHLDQSPIFSTTTFFWDVWGVDNCQEIPLWDK